jgi:hypothetical protein
MKEMEMIHARHSTGARHLGAAVASLAIAGLALGACTSGSSSSPSGGTNGSGAASGVSAELSAIAAKVHSGKGATFKATYKSTGSSSSGTIVFAQKPPKTYFSSGSTQLIDTGSTSYVCTAEGGTTTCLASGSTNPLAGVLGLFNGATITAFLQTARAQAAAHAAGYDLSYSTASYAGQPSTCVTAKGPSGTSKYCVTDSGIIAYVSTPDGNVFELTDYSTDVSDAQFQLPAGATNENLPSGVSVP